MLGWIQAEVSYLSNQKLKLQEAHPIWPSGRTAGVTLRKSEYEYAL